jgi:hypothetical protein
MGTQTPVMGESQAVPTANKVKLVIFWVVAAALIIVFGTTKEQSGLIWLMRVLVLVAWAGFGFMLIKMDDFLNNDSTAFDLWTIPHAWAGVVFGTWVIPLPLVLALTIAWEFFEHGVKGFGDKEILSNRVVDVAVAIFMWIIVTGVIVQVVSVPGQPVDMPWLLPTTGSLLR